MATLILINSITLVYGGAAVALAAGDQVSDTRLQTAITDAGGLLAPAGDPYVAAAATYVATLRSKGANEAKIDQAMQLALAASSYAVTAGISSPVANAAAMRAIPAAVRVDGMIVEKLDDGTLWRFSAASSAADATSSLVVTPTAGTGRWLLMGTRAVLTLPFTYATADNAALFTTPAGVIMVARDAWWEISSSMTGGSLSAVGVHCSNTNTTKGDVLGGAVGDVAGTLVAGTAPFAAVGTQGTKMDTLAHQRVHMVAGDTFRYDRITSAFTAGGGNVRVLVDLLQNAGA